MTLDRDETQRLQDAMEKAKELFAHDEKPRHMLYLGNRMYYVATLYDIGVSSRFAGYPTLFSSPQ